MLACTALVGCNSSDDIVNNNENNDGLKNFVTKVSLNFPDINNDSRAYDPSKPIFSHGDETEYEVKSIVVKFYDANKKYLGDGTTGQWTTQEEGNTVTKYADVTFRSVYQPYYAVAFVNDPTSPTDLQQKNISEMKEVKFTDEQVTLEKATSSTTGFFMTNSSYVSEGVIVQEVNVSKSTLEVPGGKTLEQVKASEEYGKLDAAEIYVERVVAKVNLAVDLSKSSTNQAITSGTKTLYNLKYVDTEGNEKDKYSDYAIEVVGWGLNGTNKNFYALKKIEKNWSENWYGTGRSFWAIDDNYTSGSYLESTAFDNVSAPVDETNLSLNYFSLDEITGTLNAPQYCYENTMATSETSKSAVTHVVLKAQYYEKNGETWSPVAADKYIYRINQTIYNEANMKTLIANVLMSKYDFYASADATAAMDAVTFTEKVTLKVDANDVDAKTTIALADDVVAKTKAGNVVNDVTDWTGQFNGGTIIGYKGGFCYYTIPIKHFETTETTDLGHYGVVRNHWYNLNVTSIAGFGEPGSDQPIIPEDEEELKDWVVKCKININAWAKVSQDNITVGGGTDVWN